MNMVRCATNLDRVESMVPSNPCHVCPQFWLQFIGQAPCPPFGGKDDVDTVGGISVRHELNRIGEILLIP
jgi:hypothetical protein